MQMVIVASRKHYSEHCAFPRCAVKLKVSAMFVNYSSGDRQSQPGAAFAFRAEERIEDAFLNFLRNALSSIGHLKDQVAVIDACFKPDRPAGRGEFDRVRNQVEKRLFEPPLIGLDRADPGRAAHRQRQILVAGALALSSLVVASRRPNLFDFGLEMQSEQVRFLAIVANIGVARPELPFLAGK